MIPFKGRLSIKQYNPKKPKPWGVKVWAPAIPTVPPKRREDGKEVLDCSNEVLGLQREVDEQRKKIASISQQPTCSPVFRRFLTRFLKLINKVGLPTNNEDNYYNAKVKITKQGVAELQKFLESGDSWHNGAMDDALGQLLVDVKALDYEVWKWHFEDSFGVDIDTVLKVSLAVLVVTAIICTQLWSLVSWFVQFKRMFAVCFFLSIVWNWLYLYKIAFAQHQSGLAKMEGVYDKCTGVKKMDWKWFRSTWTLQDDPCKRYYELLVVSPILLVPPTKAISVTITTFITEPLKHIGQGIGEFLRALLQDLPITLQIPVLLTIVLSILVVFYGGVQAVFQHGIMAPLRGPRDPPPPPIMAQPQLAQLEQAQAQPAGPPPAQLRLADPRAAGDAPQRGQQARVAGGGGLRRRRPRGGTAAVAAAPPRVTVETLGDEGYSQDEADVLELAEGHPNEAVLRRAGDPRAQGDWNSDEEVEEEEEEEEEEEVGVLRQAAPRTKAQDAKKHAEGKAEPSDLKPNVPQSKQHQDDVRQAGRGADPEPAGPPGSTGDQSLSVPPEFSSSHISVEDVSVCCPVQETSPGDGL
ncbi:hypothetical protein CRUP_020702 [Coryphaenoides rupestris]|nr:hypothetical protein CRUP_020702 [Coryphaenoides rupestris]